MSHTNSVNFKCDEILPHLTSICQILSKQSTLSFLNNNRKNTHTLMNKFAKANINTYLNKRLILASKHPKKGPKLASIVVL